MGSKTIDSQQSERNQNAFFEFRNLKYVLKYLKQRLLLKIEN
jgi:hypothetical protein